MANEEARQLIELTALDAADHFVMQRGTDRLNRGSASKVVLEVDATYNSAAAHASFTAEVGKLYLLDLSALAANLTITMPATFDVGDRIGFKVTTGDDAFAAILQANTGDTLEGVTAAEWSRLFIDNEYVEIIGGVASTSWHVTSDHRVPCRAKLTPASNTTVNGAASWTAIDLAGTTPKYDVGSLVDVANDRFVIRRAGHYVITLAGAPVNALSSGEYYGIGYTLNADTMAVSGEQTTREVGSTGATDYSRYSFENEFVVDDEVYPVFRTEIANDGWQALAQLNTLTLSERL